MRPPVPVLRSFDTRRARDFWIGYLGFEIAWEHRFAPDLPLYMELRRGDCVVHLSEHHGDGSPGARLRIEVADIDAFHAALDPAYRYARPEIEETPWGAREVRVTDPSGNVLLFWAPA
ncbi:glyoxalase superfamily protein [Pontivivens nitratireducens]|uniref:glyoxalase superfamily protein n=1 Tax=Pontivivens nitratireducens TaxID=2758038 RepID=UPI00163ABF39|nr:glyoxalase superfamily protein [Pontibrevibacter nitratireducens]